MPHPLRPLGGDGDRGVLGIYLSSTIGNDSGRGIHIDGNEANQSQSRSIPYQNINSISSPQVFSLVLPPFNKSSMRESHFSTPHPFLAQNRVNLPLNFFLFFFLYIMLTKQYTNTIYKQLGIETQPIITLCKSCTQFQMIHINFHYGNATMGSISMLLPHQSHLQTSHTTSESSSHSSLQTQPPTIYSSKSLQTAN